MRHSAAPGVVELGGSYEKHITEIAVILFALVLMLFGMALGKDVFLILALIIGCAGILRTFCKELFGFSGKK